MGVGAQLLVFGNEKVLFQLEQLLRICYRQPSKYDLINQTEDRCVGADAQRQRKHGNHGEAWSLAQHAQAVTQILNEVVDQVCATHLAAFLLRPLDSAELQTRSPHGFLSRHPTPNQILDVCLYVES